MAATTAAMEEASKAKLRNGFGGRRRTDGKWRDCRYRERGAPGHRWYLLVLIANLL